jgi:adenylate kinase family enzyme
MTNTYSDTLLNIILVMQFGMVQISAGDLLRAKIAIGSENGKSKRFMEKGILVLDEIVVMVLFYFFVTTVSLLDYLVKVIWYWISSTVSVINR